MMKKVGAAFELKYEFTDRLVCWNASENDELKQLGQVLDDLS